MVVLAGKRSLIGGSNLLVSSRFSHVRSASLEEEVNYAGIRGIRTSCFFSFSLFAVFFFFFQWVVHT